MTQLQTAIIEQLGYTVNDFEDADSDAHEEIMGTIDDIRNHGADTGWTGFTYYSDTVEFVKNNRKEIRELIREMAAETEHQAIEFIMSFNCLDRADASQREAAGRFVYGGKYEESDNCAGEIVYNALAWFALEEVARQLEQ
jgi:hypothetical protein